VKKCVLAALMLIGIALCTEPGTGSTSKDVVRIGDTIPEVGGWGYHNMSMTLLSYRESDIAVNGPYWPDTYYAFTTKPGRKFVILIYKFKNNWNRPQTTPYIDSGEVTTDRGNIFPLADLSIYEYDTRDPTQEEIDELAKDSAGYVELWPGEESEKGRVVFEIPEDERPVEIKLSGVPPTIKLIPEENLPPAVLIKSPKQGEIVADVVRINIGLDDPNEDMLNVDLKIDGKVVQNWLTDPGVAYDWDTSTVDDGTHMIKVTATDGEYTSIQEVSVIVDNLNMTREIERLTAEVETLQGQVATLTQEKAALIGERAQLEEQKRALESEVESLRNHVNVLESQASSLQTQIQSLKDEKTHLTTQLTLLEGNLTTLTTLLDAAYANNTALAAENKMLRHNIEELETQLAECLEQHAPEITGLAATMVILGLLVWRRQS